MFDGRNRVARFSRQTAGFSVEAGRVGGPLLPSGSTGLLTAGSIFVATDTPVGPVYLGFGHARGGNNAVHLYLGAP